MPPAALAGLDDDRPRASFVTTHQEIPLESVLDHEEAQAGIDDDVSHGGLLGETTIMHATPGLGKLPRSRARSAGDRQPHAHSQMLGSGEVPV